MAEIRVKFYWILSLYKCSKFLDREGVKQGVSRDEVCWDTSLQDERLRVLSSMALLKLFIEIIPSALQWPRGRLSL